MERRLIMRERCLAAVLIAAAGVARADGLIQAEQTIFGMDCAPCAYGTEQSLKKLAGVTSVTVSLNEGKASVTFAPDSETTLDWGGPPALADTAGRRGW